MTSTKVQEDGMVGITFGWGRVNRTALHVSMKLTIRRVGDEIESLDAAVDDYKVRFINVEKRDRWEKIKRNDATTRAQAIDARLKTARL